MPIAAVTNRPSLPRPEGAFVYCYLRTDSPRPYYVGKGSRRDRLTARHTVRVPKDFSRIRILRDGLTPQEASEWERFYIDKIGRKSMGSGPLLNRCDGGEGGANQDAEVLARISEKISALHAQGVFANVNSLESVAKRTVTRAANKAAELGIPEDIYLSMTKGQRGNAQKGLKANPGMSYEGWAASRRSAKAAAKYGLTEGEWLALSPKQRNCLKEWTVRYPGRNPQDWIAGVRAQRGSKPKVNKAEVLALKADGQSAAAIARRLRCSPSTISNILTGKRQLATAA